MASPARPQKIFRWSNSSAEEPTPSSTSSCSPGGARKQQDHKATHRGQEAEERSRHERRRPQRRGRRPREEQRSRAHGAPQPDTPPSHKQPPRPSERPWPRRRADTPPPKTQRRQRAQRQQDSRRPARPQTRDSGNRRHRGKRRGSHERRPTRRTSRNTFGRKTSSARTRGPPHTGPYKKVLAKRLAESSAPPFPDTRRGRTERTRHTSQEDFWPSQQKPFARATPGNGERGCARGSRAPAPGNNNPDHQKRRSGTRQNHAREGQKRRG